MRKEGQKVELVARHDTRAHCAPDRLSFAEFHSLKLMFKMEISKTRPVYNTVVFSSIFLSIAICFVTLIHVEIELHAHRQIVRVLTQQRNENIEQRENLRNKDIKSMTTMLHSASNKGE